MWSSRLVDILKHFFGFDVEQLGVFHVTLDDLECRSVIESVADTLVGYRLQFDVFFRDDLSVLVGFQNRLPSTVCQEYGQISEIVDVVVDRSDSK